MRNPTFTAARFDRKSRLLAQLGLVGILAGMGAGCSSSVFSLNEPVFTGSTANQQQILSSQASGYSAPAPTYASAPAAPYPVASSSAIQRQELPAPGSVAYAPASGPVPVAAGPQPYTPPKPFAAKGMPTPVGAVASLPPMQQQPSMAAVATPPLPVKRGTPPRTLTEQANAVEATKQPAEVQVASINPSAPLPAEMAPAAAQPAQSMAPAAPQAQAAPPAPAQSSASTGSGSFRWPVKGRVISQFGKKASGERNDGINLAVPEGTSVKAAEDGEVIYSGNELKSYGNLILVRHSNGWVSAYAHNSELKVKRGDKVRRGEVVALSGMSGGVTTPQVHFELRKDATPVDPLGHLSEG